MASPFLIALCAAFSVYCLYVGLWRRKQAAARVDAFTERLRDFRSQAAIGGAVMDDASGVRRAGEQSFMARMGEQLAAAAFSGRGGRSLMEVVEERLVLAGHPRGWHAPEYLAFCVLCIGGAILGGGLMVQAGVPAILYLAFVGIVAYYCWYDIDIQIKKRKEQAFFELPYFLDDLILSLSSGASTLNHALGEVLRPQDSSQLLQREKVLVREFRRAYEESASQARPFTDAFRAAADRIAVQDVSALVDLLIEGNRSGDPIIDELRDMSDNVYKLFEQEMETLIKKQDTTFTVATVVMMGGSFLVIATPIVLTVLKSLGGGIGG